MNGIAPVRPRNKGTGGIDRMLAHHRSKGLRPITGGAAAAAAALAAPPEAAAAAAAALWAPAAALRTAARAAAALAGGGLELLLLPAAKWRKKAGLRLDVAVACHRRDDAAHGLKAAPHAWLVDASTAADASGLAAAWVVGVVGVVAGWICSAKDCSATRNRC